MKPEKLADYTFLHFDQDSMDDRLFLHFYGQESDLHSHLGNKERYERILARTDISETFRARITELLDQTVSRIEEVHAIIQETQAELPDSVRMSAAKQRAKDRGHIV